MQLKLLMIHISQFFLNFNFVTSPRKPRKSCFGEKPIIIIHKSIRHLNIVLKEFWKHSSKMSSFNDKKQTEKGNFRKSIYHSMTKNKQKKAISENQYKWIRINMYVIIFLYSLITCFENENWTHIGVRMKIMFFWFSLPRVKLSDIYLRDLRDKRMMCILSIDTLKVYFLKFWNYKILC
jgi:hypothetical protein